MSRLLPAPTPSSSWPSTSVWSLQPFPLLWSSTIRFAPRATTATLPHPHFLNAVAKAPFYAHVTTPSLGFALVTTGGFVTTNDQQVLNEDYQPIEGLYASGNTCGMRFGEYITPIPGVSIGMCLTLGRELGKYLAAK